MYILNNNNSSANCLPFQISISFAVVASPATAMWVRERQVRVCVRERESEIERSLVEYFILFFIILYVHTYVTHVYVLLFALVAGHV